MVSSVVVAACDDTVTEDDLQKWTNNEIGLKRVREVVTDAKQPIATRVRALEVMVEKGRGMEMRVRTMLDAVEDEADRAALLRGVVETLVRHIEEKRPSLLGAKDAIMMSGRYIEPELFDRVRKAIAAWAFGDITWETPSDELREKISSRMSTGQIVDLGPYGIEAAGILLSNAFNVEQMLRFLVDTRQPEAARTAVKALRKLHRSEAPNGFQLDALSRLIIPEAAEYLFDLSRSPTLEPELRDACYNFALSLYRNPALPDATAARLAVLARMVEMLKTATPNERWLVARNIVEFSAGTMFADVLKAFPDDKSYATADEDVGKSVMDFCFDLADLPTASVHHPTIEKALREGHRVQQAIAILCAKTAEVNAMIPALREKADLVEKEGDVSVADLLGEGITIGTLSRNALEGLALMTEARTALGEGRYTKEQFENRKFLIAVEFEEHGDAYRAAIDERYGAWVESQKPPAAVEKPAPAPGGAPAPAPGGAPAPAPGGTPAPGTVPAPAPTPAPTNP
jgi:hypothetical protein